MNIQFVAKKLSIIALTMLIAPPACSMEYKLKRRIRYAIFSIANLHFKDAFILDDSFVDAPSFGLTPLHNAALAGNAAEVARLVQSGADLEAIAITHYQDWTPLHCAACAGSSACVEILVKAGANLEARDAAGYTPVLVAVMFGHIDTVKILARAGANLAAKIGLNRTIINVGILAGISLDEEEIIEYLQRVEHWTKNFMGAIDRHDRYMARRAINDGAIIVQQDQNGDSPLNKLVGPYEPEKPTTSDEIAKLIVHTIGRQVKNLRNHAGQTPLHLATGHGNKRLMRLFIGNGADVNAQDNEGNTPLHYAFDPRTVELLLQNHADITIENHQGEVSISALVLQSSHWLPLLENK